MLFLHALLFSLVGTSVFALDGPENTAAVEPNTGFKFVRIPDDGSLIGFWSRNHVTIRVDKARVYHCTKYIVVCTRAFTTTDYAAITGGPWSKLNGYFVSGLL